MNNRYNAYARWEMAKTSWQSAHKDISTKNLHTHHRDKSTRNSRIICI